MKMNNTKTFLVIATLAVAVHFGITVGLIPFCRATFSLGRNEGLVPAYPRAYPVATRAFACLTFPCVKVLTQRFIRSEGFPLGFQLAIFVNSLVQGTLLTFIGFAVSTTTKRKDREQNQNLEHISDSANAV
jgi:hypothetical protein